jgi:hypothetical protein
MKNCQTELLTTEKSFFPLAINPLCFLFFHLYLSALSALKKCPPQLAWNEIIGLKELSRDLIHVDSYHGKCTCLGKKHGSYQREF